MEYTIPSLVSTLVLDLTFYLSLSSKEETIKQLLDWGQMRYKQLQGLAKKEQLLVYYYFKTKVKEIYATSWLGAMSKSMRYKQLQAQGMKSFEFLWL